MGKGKNMEKIYGWEDGGTVLPFIHDNRTLRSADSIVELNRSTYPLYVGGKVVENNGDSAGKGSSFLLEAMIISEEYGAFDIAWEIENPAIVGFDKKEEGAEFG